MQSVIITIHLLVVIALVGAVLIQRSEGGGLGVGGGSGFMTARGAKNALTRLTAILATCFFLTSILLTVLQLIPGKDGSNILNQIPQETKGGGAKTLLDDLVRPVENEKSKASTGESSSESSDAGARGGVAPADSANPVNGANNK